MLTLTESASDLVKTIVAQNAGSPEGGLRIRGTGTPDAQFEVAVTPQPENEDKLVERDGARVFLEPNAATLLEDKVLDAQLAGDGVVRFAIAQQGEAPQA
ncbi:MAG: iron-sulfur cluster biosynthesis protein [Actinomycetales bacterium]|nr:iron-sulfur cluster biosynthesis protein [Actinomycetales bacterium]